jgi:hypothetical protein
MKIMTKVPHGLVKVAGKIDFCIFYIFILMYFVLQYGSTIAEHFAAGLRASPVVPEMFTVSRKSKVSKLEYDTVNCRTFRCGTEGWSVCGPVPVPVVVPAGRFY